MNPITKTEKFGAALAVSLIGGAYWLGPSRDMAHTVQATPAPPMIHYEAIQQPVVIQEITLKNGRKATMSVVAMKGGVIK